MADKDKTGQAESGFFARWSRRKRQAEDEEDAPLEGVQQPEPADDTETAEPEETEEEKANREAAEAVNIENLTYESDFSVFMKSGVPQFLRRRAMRKLWSTNPVLASLDGLNDYDEDYADPKLNVFKTTWNVVGGYLGKEDAGEANTAPEKADQDAEPAGDEEAEIASEAEQSETEIDPSDGDETVTNADDDGEGAQKAANQEGDTPRVSLRQRLKG